MAPLPTLNLSEPGWKLRQGQAVWRLPKREVELAGELIVAEHPDGRAFIQFNKTPLTLVQAQRQPGRWQIEFPPQDRTFRGHGNPYARLAWFPLLNGLTGKEVPSAWMFTPLPDHAWKLHNPRSGEFIEGFLNP
jgi:hypothetical protein